MMTLLKEEGDPRALSNGAIFDTYKYLASRKKGYETWLKAQDAALAETIKTKAAEVDAKHRARPNKKKPETGQ
jgi:hypothetical protein